MQVKLVSITPAAERFIAYIARVSNPDNQENPEYAKLIKFLIKNQHWSPFEHAYMTVEIKTSRAIAAQILRHRSFTFQEFSQRYSEATEFEGIEVRKQATKNRQSSLEVFNPSIKDVTTINDIYTFASSAIDEHIQLTKALYTELINAGVAKEVARMILPLTTQTTLYMTGSLRSWIHYLALRTKEDVQKEHRDIAISIQGIFNAEVPTIATALYLLEKEKQDKEYLWQLLKSNGYIDVEKFKQERSI